MKSETDPVTDDEFVLRRVHFSRFRSIGMPIISPGAFEPRLPGKSRDPDIDGISLYREACLSKPKECLLPVSADKRSDWGIIRLPVSGIRSLNMSLRSVQDDRVSGHVVIPELSAAEFQKHRDR